MAWKEGAKKRGVRIQEDDNMESLIEFGRETFRNVQDTI